MKGDFSRDSFDAQRDVYRVLMQQGRVQLDADWNEAAAVFLHRLETIVRDAFGPYGGPEEYCGFAVFAAPDGDVGIGAGRYYVDGLLCENHRPVLYGTVTGQRLESGHSYIAYLDVWEQFVAPAASPALIDPALGGLDTSARSRLAWRVRAQRVDTLPSRDEIGDGWPYAYLDAALIGPRGRLAASVDASGAGSDPALGTTSTGYHGTENRLYRVEIHDPGTAAGGATFKWSRDNGAVVFPIRSVSEKIVTLAAFGRDEDAAIVAGDWVEIVDDDDAAGLRPARGLFGVASASPADRTVTLAVAAGYAVDPQKHPVLRRWDQGSAPLDVVETAAGDDAALALEAGIAIRFAAAPDADPAFYRSGDYWMIPARTAGGGVLLWPEAVAGTAEFREPAGIAHRYAPLAGISITEGGIVRVDHERHDYRRRFRPLGERAS